MRLCPGTCRAHVERKCAGFGAQVPLRFVRNRFLDADAVARHAFHRRGRALSQRLSAAGRPVGDRPLVERCQEEGVAGDVESRCRAADGDRHRGQPAASECPCRDVGSTYRRPMGAARPLSGRHRHPRAAFALAGWRFGSRVGAVCHVAPSVLMRFRRPCVRANRAPSGAVAVYLGAALFLNTSAGEDDSVGGSWLSRRTKISSMTPSSALPRSSDQIRPPSPPTSALTVVEFAEGVV